MSHRIVPRVSCAVSAPSFTDESYAHETMTARALRALSTWILRLAVTLVSAHALLAFGGSIVVLDSLPAATHSYARDAAGGGAHGWRRGAQRPLDLDGNMKERDRGGAGSTSASASLLEIKTRAA